MTARILIVDDEESLRFTFEAFLAKEGHLVTTAGDYESALRLIAEEEFDLLLVDIILGGGTGTDLLHEVKKRGLRCPVIMITGEPNVETSAEAVRMGAFDYLAKPVRKDTLLKTTDRALHHKAVLDEKDRIEAEKNRYRKNLEAIFRSLNDAVLTVDHEMRVIEANEQAARICGFEMPDLAGTSFGSAPKRCSGLCREVLATTLRTNSTVKEHRIQCRHEDRPRQVVLLTCSPLTDRQDTFMGAVLVVRDITRLSDLERELKDRYRSHRMVGKSKRMQEMFALLEELTDIETTVLITGESGTGKELVARALHYGGGRAGNALVKVNCSALAENLLESELFGHVKGAFTGAVRNKVGRFQLADGGTIFLDEIGDISPRIQLNLLRVLQEHEFERVGDARPVKVDVRVIAATNCDLRQKVKRGEFRQDLYYRLKVVEVALPTLAERREDIPLLAEYFFDHFLARFNKDISGVSEEALAAFMHYPWPGNVRELEHAVEHAFVLCRSGAILLEHLPVEIRQYGCRQVPGGEKRPTRERDGILGALEKTDWNKAKAARILGMSRQTIYRKIRELNLIEPER